MAAPIAPNARWDRIALVAIVLGAVIRAVWVLGLHPPVDNVYSDMAGYVDRAVKIAAGGGLDRYDAFYPPGTHLILALPLVVFGVDRTGLWAGAVLWWALSAFTPLAMWRFARYHLSVGAASLAAMFVSLWPIHIAYSGYFMSETPSLALLLGSLWLTARASSSRSVRGLLSAGIAGGLAVANRPALIANLIVAVLSVGRGSRMRALACIGIGTAAILALIVAHNSIATKQLTFISENSGLTFFIGHCDAHIVKMGDPARGLYYEFGSPPAMQRANGRDYTFTDHMPWDQAFFYGQALECIRNDGLGHLRTIARGVLDMTLTTVPWPPSTERDLGARIAVVNATFSALLPLIIGGSVWLIRERRRRGEKSGEAVMLAHFACVLVTAIVFYGDPRYRELYDVFALALAAALIAHLFIDQRISGQLVDWHEREIETVPAGGG